MSGRQWRDALDAACDLPDDRPEKIAELERIAAYADAVGHVRLGVEARFALIETYRFRGERWRLVEPLRHCLATVDQHPAVVEPSRVTGLLGYQPIAVAAALGSPRIGLDQIRALLDDLARRSAEQACGSVAELRCRLADQLGDDPSARQWFARWRAAGPGDGCAGCVAVRQAELLADWGEWTEAVRLLEPVVAEPGDCTEQPEAALATLLLPYLRLGRYEDAGRAHVRAYQRHRREQAAFGYLPAHLVFCALGRQLARGLEILVDQLPRLTGPVDERYAMEFAAAGALLCRLAGEAGVAPPGAPADPEPIRSPQVTLGLEHATRLAEAFGLVRVPPPAGGSRSARLGAELLATATDLAGRFDARNGTGHQSGRIAARMAERPVCAVPVPLPTAGAPVVGGDRLGTTAPGLVRAAAPATGADSTGAASNGTDHAGTGSTGSSTGLARAGSAQAGSTQAGSASVGPTAVGSASVGGYPVGSGVAGAGAVGSLVDGPGAPGAAVDDVGRAEPVGVAQTGAETADGVPPEQPAPLTVTMIVAAVEQRGDRCAVDPDGTVVGRWGEAVIRFERVGAQAEILHARVVATRRLPAQRRTEAYEFVNAWNRDRLLPKAYVHEAPGGELVLAGDVTTDLAVGVAPVQVEVLVESAVSTGVAYAEAVAALP